MRLEALLEGTDYELIRGTLDKKAEALIYHSDESNKENNKGSVFFAIKGEKTDGHRFIKELADEGVRSFVVEDGDAEFPEDATVIRTADTRKALALASRNFFGRPDEELTVIGITGTKGKTGTSFMLKAILENAGIKTGIIGTVKQGFAGHYKEAANTTPQSFEIYSMLREMAEGGCEAVVMEVSSQALMQQRTAGIEFDIGIFTNLSPDHIGAGEHKSFAEYAFWKSCLFRQSRIAVLNGDSEYSPIMLRNSRAEKAVFFGISQAEDIRTFRNRNALGSRFVFHGEKFTIPFPGEFNVYNVMAAMTAAHELGIEYESMREAFEGLRIPGRTEVIPAAADYTVVLDYAHNGVAMKNLLEALRMYKPERLVAVFGCGGERDRRRRADMGEAAGSYADLSVITSDNPRNEPPERIIEDISDALSRTGGKYVIISDRQKALEWSIANAQKGDIIAVCGKGHETYQIIGNNKSHFDDKEVILSIIGRKK